VLENRRAVVGDNYFSVSCLDLFAEDVSMTAKGIGSGSFRRTILSIPLGPSDVRTASATAICKD
jgi:hypothetical protein